MAVPLCLPNNCKWNARTGQYIKTGEGRSSLYVVDEALQQLRTIRGPVCVVSIAGPYRKGKSFALSEAFNQPNVFPLGHHMDPETMGIWLWVVPEKTKDSNGRDCTVVLLDSEGIDAVRGEGFDDNQIFTLTVLLASVLIYNSAGVPTRNDLNGLDFIVKLSQRIQLRTSKGAMGATGRQSDTESFHKTFPFFIWLLRDVTQSVPPDCRDIQEYFLTRVFKQQGFSNADQNQEVAESILRFFPGFRGFKLPPPTADAEVSKNLYRNKSKLNPEFISGLEHFKSLLTSVLAPKHSFNDGDIVTGEGLAALIQLYVEAIDTPGVIPNIQTAWDTFVGNKCSEAQLAAVRTYEALMTAQLSGQLPCDNDVIRQCHDAALEEGIRQLEADMFGISSITIERCLKELTESINTTLSSWTRENERLTKESCTRLLEELTRQHLDPVLAQLHGPDVSKVSFDDIVAGYKRIEQDFQNRASGAKDVCAAVFFEFHPELMKEMQQYLGMLRQMKDFDEKLTREIAAKAYQRQEKKRLEEENARLQQETRERQKEIKMLSAKQDEERARLRDQIEADAKAQRDQIENMIKASMKQAEKERRAFMQENQSLQRLVEINTKSNERMQRNIENLQQQLAAIRCKQQEVEEPGFLDIALKVVSGIGTGLAAVATAVALIPMCSVM